MGLWTVLPVVLLTYLTIMFVKTPKYKGYPEGYALAKRNHMEQSSSDQLSREDYELHEIAANSLEHRNYIDEHAYDSFSEMQEEVENSGEMNNELNLKNVVKPVPTEPGEELKNINENSYSSGIHSRDDPAKKTESVDTLADKRKSMKPFLNRVYHWKEFDENFDAALKTLNVNYLQRLAAKKVRLQEKLLENEKRDGDWDYNLVLKVYHTDNIKFKLGKSVTYLTKDGRIVQSTFTLPEKKVLFEEQNSPDNKISYWREYSTNHMNLTANINGVVTQQTYVV